MNWLLIRNISFMLELVFFLSGGYYPERPSPSPMYYQGEGMTSSDNQFFGRSSGYVYFLSVSRWLVFLYIHVLLFVVHVVVILSTYWVIFSLFVTFGKTWALLFQCCKQNQILYCCWNHKRDNFMCPYSFFYLIIILVKWN